MISDFIVLYRLLVTLEIEWEESLSSAAAALGDESPLLLDFPGNYVPQLVFLLYPSSGHEALARTTTIEDTLREMQINQQARIILVACHPTFPPLDEQTVVALANQKLSGFPRKNVVRALDAQTLATRAESHMRFALQQAGQVLRGVNRASDDDDPFSSSLRNYGAQPWNT